MGEVQKKVNATLNLLKTGGSLSGALNEAQGSDIASASTCDIGAATGNYVVVTGTTTITALGTVQAGTRREVTFSGALTLTHNATSLILPTGANITTAAGDSATFISLGSGNWVCTNYQRKDGTALVSTGGGSMGTFIPLPLHGRAVTSSTNLIVTANTTAYYGAFLLPLEITVNKLTIKSGGAVTTASTFDIGIYSEDGQTKEIDITTASIAAINTSYTTAVSSIILSKGIHWVVIVANGSVNLQLCSWLDTGIMLDGISSEPVYVGKTTVTAGTLPTTFDPTSITYEAYAHPMIRLDN